MIPSGSDFSPTIGRPSNSGNRGPRQLREDSYFYTASFRAPTATAREELIPSGHHRVLERGRSASTSTARLPLARRQRLGEIVTRLQAAANLHDQVRLAQPFHTST